VIAIQIVEPVVVGPGTAKGLSHAVVLAFIDAQLATPVFGDGTGGSRTAAAGNAQQRGSAWSWHHLVNTWS